MAKNILIWLINQYKRWISPMLGSRCRFYPSCSSYAVHALQEYSLPKALAHIVWRVIRCSPVFGGGYDPIKRQE